MQCKASIMAVFSAAMGLIDGLRYLEPLYISGMRGRRAGRCRRKSSKTSMLFVMIRSCVLRMIRLWRKCFTICAVCMGGVRKLFSWEYKNRR